MKYSKRLLGFVLIACMFVTLTGCSRYVSNRYYDFRDMFHVGVGVTAENPVTGVIPPTIGLYLEATDWLQLGAITHNGYTAEMDMRGTFVGPESTSRAGFLWWQSIRKNEDYKDASYYNIFKNKDFPWCQRMESLDMRWKGHPAKQLHYEFWSQHQTEGIGLLHRGYQYWEYIGAEVGICEPFLTHMGLLVRLGFDPSELSDFVLGIFTIDFKHDDMTADEYLIKEHGADTWGLEVRPVESRAPEM